MMDKKQAWIDFTNDNPELAGTVGEYRAFNRGFEAGQRHAAPMAADVSEVIEAAKTWAKSDYCRKCYPNDRILLDALDKFDEAQDNARINSASGPARNPKAK
jgi:hypothetical protein